MDNALRNCEALKSSSDDNKIHNTAFDINTTPNFRNKGSRPEVMDKYNPVPKFELFSPVWVMSYGRWAHKFSGIKVILPFRVA